MTNTDSEARRREVAELLKQGLDYKLLRGGSKEAMSRLRKARALATCPDPLPWPWPQLTAYRLAYLTMRDARSEAAVRKVLALLDETADGRVWPDPLQYGFLCAVLVRLSSASKGDERKAFQHRIASALKDMGRAERVGASRHNPVQTEILNIAEILTFASGADYLLEGLGGLPGSHVPSRDEDAFFLVGTHGVDSGIAMTEPFARGEFDDRMDDADIAFEWTERRGVTKPEGLSMPHSFMLLLPGICRGRRLGAEATDENIRTTIHRQRAAIVNLVSRPKGLNIPPTEVIEHKGPQTYAFHPDIRVLGLVQRSKWPRAAHL